MVITSTVPVLASFSNNGRTITVGPPPATATATATVAQISPTAQTPPPVLRQSCAVPAAAR